MGMVLDASATLAWLIKRVDATEARLADEILCTLHSEEALVPSLWFSEVANGVLVAERRGGLASATSASFLALLGAVPVVVDAMQPALVQGRVMALARSYGLTAYDAAYLELSMRSASTLATFDRKLAAAARSAGVPVIGVAV